MPAGIAIIRTDSTGGWLSSYSKLRWEYIALIFVCVRAAILIRICLSTPVEVVGDYDTDYFPRGKYFSQNGTLATSGDISDFVYLRPPATSLIIAGINALGFGIVEIAFIVRGQNVILDFLSLLLLVGVLGFMRISSPFKLMLCAFLASQPYTIS